jgi:hypothetical protein
VQSISNDLGQSTNLISERFKFIIWNLIKKKG